MDDGHLPFLCLQYHDSAGVKHLVPAVYLGDVDSMDGSKLKDMVVKNDSFAPKVTSKVYRTGFPNVALTNGDALP
nr:DExH-box ATP-dependent RNA helicase DExH15 chloroplastic [Tanacetum cinerariifolium]